MSRVQLRAGGPSSILKLLSISAVALMSVAGQARAQSVGDNGAVFLTAPFVAAGGEQVLLCAANVAGLTIPTAPSPTAADPANGGVTLSLTLSILNGVTGAVVSSTPLTLPPLGSTQYPTDPCLQFSVPSVAGAAFAPASNLFIASVALNPQPLPPAKLPRRFLRTSLQIFTLDANGNPTHVRVLSVYPPNPCLPIPGIPGCTIQAPAN